MNRTVEILGVDLEVEFDHTPYRPAVMYLRNGDPGYPAEGGDIDVTDVFLAGTSVIDLLSDWTLQQIQSQLEAVDFDRERAEEAVEFECERRRDEALSY